MALTKCRECGSQVSTAAAACPHCGAPQQATPPPILSRAGGDPQPQARDEPPRIESATASDKATIHLKRAWGLIERVTRSTEEFRELVAQEEASDDANPPQGVMSGFAQGW